MSIFFDIFFSNVLNCSFFLPIIGILLLVILHNIAFLQYFVSILIPILFISKNLIFYLRSDQSIIEQSFIRFTTAFEIKFQYSILSNTFLLMVGLLWLLNDIYSIGYIKIKKMNYTYFMSFIFLSISVVSLIAYSGNLITLFFFYEVLTVVTYFLVAYTREENYEIKLASGKYLRVLMVTSACFFLTAIVISFSEIHSFAFMNSGIMEFFYISSWWIVPILLILFLYGCSKSATWPFHFWLPEAMIAEIPVSALLHAVAVVKSGILALLYIVSFYFGIKFLSEQYNLHPIAFSIPKYLAGFSAIYSSVMAIKKHEIKRVLAYSTIGQLGYMVMIIFSFHGGMENIVIMQLIAHAVAKINMFFCVGVFYLKYKLKKISDLNSLAKKEFILCLCFAISALSVIGLPPTIGVISKFNVLLYAARNEEFFILGVLLLGTMLNCYYFLPIISKMFFEGRRVDCDNYELKEYSSDPTLYVPIIIVGFSIVFLFCVLI